MKLFIALTIILAFALVAFPVVAAIPLYQAGLSPWGIAAVVVVWTTGIAGAIRLLLIKLDTGNRGTPGEAPLSSGPTLPR